MRGQFRISSRRPPGLGVGRAHRALAGSAILSPGTPPRPAPGSSGKRRPTWEGTTSSRSHGGLGSRRRPYNRRAADRPAYASSAVKLRRPCGVRCGRRAAPCGYLRRDHGRRFGRHCFPETCAGPAASRGPVAASPLTGSKPRPVRPPPQRGEGRPPSRFSRGWAAATSGVAAARSGASTGQPEAPVAGGFDACGATHTRASGRPSAGDPMRAVVVDAYGGGSDPIESEVAKWRTSRRVRPRMYSPRRW